MTNDFMSSEESEEGNFEDSSNGSHSVSRVLCTRPLSYKREKVDSFFNK